MAFDLSEMVNVRSTAKPGDRPDIQSKEQKEFSNSTHDSTAREALMPSLRTPGTSAKLAVRIFYFT